MPANFSKIMCDERGFTLIELVVIVMILGILAVVAIPRMGNADYKTQEFRDKVVSALRYAQKTSVSHRRLVCVSFTTSSVTLQINTAAIGTTCSASLVVPGTNSNTVNSPDPAKAYFTPASSLAVLNFLPDGTSGGRQLFIPGESVIVVEGATGYVN